MHRPRACVLHTKQRVSLDGKEYFPWVHRFHHSTQLSACNGKGSAKHANRLLTNRVKTSRGHPSSKVLITSENTGGLSVVLVQLEHPHIGRIPVTLVMWLPIPHPLRFDCLSIVDSMSVECSCVDCIRREVVWSIPILPVEPLEMRGIILVDGWRIATQKLRAGSPSYSSPSPQSLLKKEQRGLVQ